MNSTNLLKRGKGKRGGGRALDRGYRRSIIQPAVENKDVKKRVEGDSAGQKEALKNDFEKALDRKAKMHIIDFCE